MTEEEAKEGILSKLGFPVVKVEIDDTQWPHIFRGALRWFRAKKGLISCYMLPIADGIVEYPVPPNSYKIVDVVFPRKEDIGTLFNLCMFDLIPANGMFGGNYGFISSSFADYVQALQTIETRKKIFGADPDWIEECGKLIITPYTTASFATGYPAVVYYKADNIQFNDLKGRDEDLIYRYATNEARYVLAKIRGKYKTYPSADGQINTDADDLMTEYREEKEALEMEISDSQGAMPFLVY